MPSGRPPAGDIESARSWLGMSDNDLWIGYFSVGGNGTLADIQRWLAREAEPGDRDHDLLAQALNDEFVVRNLDHPVAYRSDRLSPS